MKAVNLIPVEERGGSGPAAGRSEGGAYAVVVVLAGLAGLVFLYGTARHQIASRKVQAASLAVQIQRAQVNASQLAPYTSFLGLREQRQQTVSELAQSRFDWARAFHELGRVLPSDVSISSLNGTIGSASGIATPAGKPGVASGSAVSSATPPGSVPVVTLAGCAKSQSVVAQTLNRLRLIEGVSAVTLQSSTQTGGGSGSASGGCPGTDPAFSVQIGFDPLPAVSSTSTAAAAATKSKGGAG
jgi:Tfp pilus assembly protein PilN